MISPMFSLAVAVTIVATASACSAPSPSTDEIAEAVASGTGGLILIEADDDTLQRLSREAGDRNWIATIEGGTVRIKPVAADTPALASFLNDMKAGKFGKLRATRIGFISEPPAAK